MEMPRWENALLRLEEALLRRCGKFTAASFLVAASILLGALFVQFESTGERRLQAVNNQPVFADGKNINVKNISLESVIFARQGREITRVDVYFSNYSNQAGLVQLRSESVDAGDDAAPVEGWMRRRVPRFDHLVYSMYLPNDLDPSTIILYLRGQSAEDVREFQLASYGGVQEWVSMHEESEAYAQNM